MSACKIVCSTGPIAIMVSNETSTSDLVMGSSPTSFILADSTLRVLIAVAIIVLAVMVIRAVIYKKELHEGLHKYHYWFVANLMVCDIVTAITVNPLYITLYVAKMSASVLYTVHCGYSLAVIYIAPISSGFMVVNLAIDAALAVTYPFRYKVIMNKRKAVIMVAIAWLLGAAFTLPISASPLLDVEVDDLQLCPHDLTAFLALPVVRLATAIAIIALNIYLCWVTINVTMKHRCLVGVAGRNTNTKKSLRKQIKKYKAAIGPCVTLLLIIVTDGILRVIRIVLVVVAINKGFIHDDAFKLIFNLATWMEFIIHPMVYGLMLRKICRVLFCKK